MLQNCKSVLKIGLRIFLLYLLSNLCLRPFCKKTINLFSLLFYLLGAGRTVLVVSQVDDQGDLLTPVVEVYDFLSRTWRIFEPPLSSKKDSNLPKSNTDKRKKHAARLINEDSLLEFDLAVPSIKKESLPPNVEGGAPFYYGDTLCLAGGYNTNDSLLLKNVDCWNPLQGKFLLSLKKIYDRCPKLSKIANNF